MTQRRKVSATRSGHGIPLKSFTPALLDGLSDDIVKGRIPVGRITITDEQVSGLRAVVRRTGLVSFHVSYRITDEDDETSRPFLKLGDYPKMKIEEARRLARTVIALAERNIDPQEGLHERLIAELKEKGTRWRPA